MFNLKEALAKLTPEQRESIKNEMMAEEAIASAELATTNDS